MAQMWRPQSKETHKYWVDTIQEEASDKLTEWESDFVMNISLQLSLGRTLSEAQERNLERIYAEKTT